MKYLVKWRVIEYWEEIIEADSPEQAKNKIQGENEKLLNCFIDSFFIGSIKKRDNILCIVFFK